MVACRVQGDGASSSGRGRDMGAWEPERWVTDNDRGRSRTSYSLDDLQRSVRSLQDAPVERLLDIGCGYGGLAALVGGFVGAHEVHGIDIDPRVESEAQSKGVQIQVLDAGERPLPYPDGFFDVVMTLGMMDYLVSFDGMIREINRVLAPNGRVLVTLPNLSSWHNRLALLAGYQPRDVEISNEVLAGVSRGFAGEYPAGHIHIPTLRAFKELMDHHGFEAVELLGGRPRQRSVPKALFAIDRLMSRSPSLARRFYYVGRKVAPPPPIEQHVDHPYQSLR